MKKTTNNHRRKTEYRANIIGFTVIAIIVMLLGLAASAESATISNLPPYTAWSVQDNSATLYYAIMTETNPILRVEGELEGLQDKPDIEALTISPDGMIYIMNNTKRSKLYRIQPSAVDGDAETAVAVEYIGSTGLSAGNSNQEITNLQFIDGLLYGISKGTKKIWLISTEDGSVTQHTKLDVNGSFRTDGMTVAADGSVYLLNVKNKDSEVWKFTDFESGTVEKVMTVEGSGKVETLTAHPDGTLIVADEDHWYELDPAANTVTVVADGEYDIEGMDYYYQAEEVHYENRDEDGDGMKDVWEEACSLDPADPTDSQTDLDGDGASNYEEYRAGTDPLDVSSRFKLKVKGEKTNSGQHAKLEWPAAPDRSYGVWRATCPTGPWEKIATGLSSAEEFSIYDDFDVQDETTYFYRIEIE